jgi:hypothetical protein
LFATIDGNHPSQQQAVQQQQHLLQQQYLHQQRAMGQTNTSPKQQAQAHNPLSASGPATLPSYMTQSPSPRPPSSPPININAPHRQHQKLHPPQQLLPNAEHTFSGSFQHGTPNNSPDIDSVFSHMYLSDTPPPVMGETQMLTNPCTHDPLWEQTNMEASFETSEEISTTAPNDSTMGDLFSFPVTDADFELVQSFLNP